MPSLLENIFAGFEAMSQVKKELRQSRESVDIGSFEFDSLAMLRAQDPEVLALARKRADLVRLFGKAAFVGVVGEALLRPDKTFIKGVAFGLLGGKAVQAGKGIINSAAFSVLSRNF